MIGTTVDQYKIIERIAGGGMGEVYKAIDLELEREVAIKCVRPELSDLEEATKRFRAEARTLAKLSHLNIATVYRFFAEDDRLFLVMEYIDGRPFGDIITSQGAIPHEQAVNLVKDALQGLGYAHRNKIVHRDIKPGNLMLDQENTVKVLDFGIAHLIGGTRLTRVGSAVGTPAYMSPEQVLGKDIDQRTDIYAIGVVLYEMLSGKLPYTANSDFELMRAHLEEVPRPLSELAENDVPPALQETVERALAKDTEARFQTAEEFANALDDAERSTTRARTTIVPPPPPPPDADTVARTADEPQADRAQQRKWIGLGAAAALVLAVLAFMLWPGEDAERVLVDENDDPAAAAVSGQTNVDSEATPAAGSQGAAAGALPTTADSPLQMAEPDVDSRTEGGAPLPRTAPATASNALPAADNTAPARNTASSTRVPPPARSVVNEPTRSTSTPRPAALPQARVATVKVSVHERQGTGRFSRDAGYNGAFRLTVPSGASRNWLIDEVAKIYRDGELVREQTVTSEMRTPGTFKSKQRIEGMKTLEPGEYQVELLFINEGTVLGTYEWKLLVTG